MRPSKVHHRGASSRLCWLILRSIVWSGACREKYPQRGKGSEKGRYAGVHLIRYADDFIITGRTKELLEQQVKPLVEEFLRVRGLELSAEKTRVTHIEEGFDFLGQNLRRYSNGKLLIKPSRKNIHTFLETVREVIRSAQAIPTWQLITKLNRIIRGWAMYHGHVNSKRIFSRVDHAIIKTLWQWALKRHPEELLCKDIVVLVVTLFCFSAFSATSSAMRFNHLSTGAPGVWSYPRSAYLGYRLE
jgi:Group II intron, maturase-specific domain/Reverse transcriptase (RNA-dependent DNA polymerase)